MDFFNAAEGDTQPVRSATNGNIRVAAAMKV
jgi:hypothetical protein